MKKLESFPVKDIIISEDFKDTDPASWKLQHKVDYYKQHGELPKDIMINDENVLIDGYTTYLAAVMFGLEYVPIKVGYVELIEASVQVLNIFTAAVSKSDTEAQKCNKNSIGVKRAFNATKCRKMLCEIMLRYNDPFTERMCYYGKRFEKQGTSQRNHPEVRWALHGKIYIFRRAVHSV